MAERLDYLRAHARRAAQSYSMHMAYNNAGATELSRNVFLQRRTALWRYQDTAIALAQVYVKKGMPGGSPSWLSEFTMRFV